MDTHRRELGGHIHQTIGSREVLPILEADVRVPEMGDTRRIDDIRRSEILRIHPLGRREVNVSVPWLQFLTSSTSELGDGGARFDQEHQQQGNTVPLALQGVE